MKKNLSTGIVGFLIVAAVFCIGVKALISNLAPFFGMVDTRIKEGQTVVMNGKVDPAALEKLFVEGGYMADPVDAAFVAKWYAERINGGEQLPNLGALNSQDRFGIPAEEIEKAGGSELKARLQTSYEALGQDEEWSGIDVKTLSSSFGKENSETVPFRVHVSDGSKENKGKDVAGVAVRLTEHWQNDSVLVDNLPEHYSRTVGFAVTDNDGNATFHVPAGKSYSAVPIARGFQFGREKGTTDGPLADGFKTVNFTRKPHTITPLKSSAYLHMKNDNALVARSPADYLGALRTGCIVFILSWLVTFLYTAILDRRQGRSTDFMLLLVLMTLTGMGILTLYGQMRPLTDIFSASKMIWYCVGGCALLMLLSSFNYLKLFQRYSSRFGNIRSVGAGALRAAAPGYPFLIASVLLMVLLVLIGQAPEGSDAKVNIALPGFQFQPSEVIKYLMVVFMAFFFFVEGDVIRTYGEQLTMLSRRRQWVITGIVLVAIAFICLLFLGMLKDMGPGIVILATFIMLYSLVRRDFPQLMLGVFSYILLVGAAYMISSQPVVRLTAVGLWFVLWISYGLFRKKKVIYESALFFNALVSMFLVGGYLIRPFLPHMADRLFNRTNMAWSGIFDNAIPQGDQIAQGLWGTASGGFSGMGLGGGAPYFIPAGHTDLILSSLGEQMGWLGILLVAICFYILISRTASAAMYSGHKFTMYLCLGLGLITGVQFLFISLGSVGVLPLSGVPVPFMSYSGTSIVAALAAYGIVISISRHRGSREALKAFVVSNSRAKDDRNVREARSLYRNVLAGMVLFVVSIAVVTAVNGYYQLIAADSTKIRPAITSTAQGLRVMDYNPRIKQILDMLGRGNIYDRNGLLLATSERADIKDYERVRDSLGIALPELAQIKAQYLKRYYPFGSNLVFIVGDLNRPDAYTSFKGAAPMGFLAENRLSDSLRGLDSKAERIELHGSDYKYNRFLPPVSDAGFKFSKHDYSFLLPALKQSAYNNDWVKNFNNNRKSRDIQLAVDAVLQTRMQEALASYLPTTYPNKKQLRASVVVLDALNGDMLTSANYPLPDADSIIMLRELGYDRLELPSEGRPGVPLTERDLGTSLQTAPGSTAKVMTAMAGLRKLGPAAYDTGYEIKPQMTVEGPGNEPNTSWPGSNRNGGRITYMENAIRYSSNCYFIMLLNDKDLYKPLGEIYGMVGASVGHSSLHPTANSYFFDMSEYDAASKNRLTDYMNTFAKGGLADYRRYMNNYKGDGTDKKMSSIQNWTGLAWGQSGLLASPLNMARVASIAANGGKLTPTRYLLGEPVAKPVEVLDVRSAELIKSAMMSESDKHIGNKRLSPALKGNIGGKTGTPERFSKLLGKKSNDAWYMCFIKNPSTGKTFAVALRMERTGVQGESRRTSTEAVRLLNEVVIPVLQKSGYVD